MNENENENEQIYTEQDALQAIHDIAKTGLSNEKILNEIESDLTDINQHIANLDENVVIFNNEQETEKNSEESEEEISEQNKNNESSETSEQETESITMEDIHSEIIQVNKNIEMTNYILSGNILFMGVIAGIVLFKIMWDRLKK